MPSQQFQTTHARILNLSHRLLQFLEEYRKGSLAEGDETESLQTVQETIQSAIHGLIQQKYEVAIVAPMKAGKSTFLNAIIGADILASESAACTICRTDIRHIEARETPCLLEYHDNSTKPVVTAQGDAHEVQQKFLRRTRQLRSDAKHAQDMPTRFELRYPIEAIQSMSALAGFTLIDTPGPNEWKSMSVDTVALKQVALEALRTCKAVLFVLNYRSFKDKAVDELFQSITSNRQELLLDNESRIFFILNQVDLKSEKDPEVAETVSLLKNELTGFGFPDPIVYPVSALQGLLAKLIQQGAATENQIKDFKKFFSARYARENEDGDMVTPAPKKIASQAVQDSGIIAVQEAVFQTVIQTSGWILHDDTLKSLEKAAKAIEDTFNTQISGWETEINILRNKVEDYKSRSQSAMGKVDSVRRAIDKQKDLLWDGFSAGVDAFTEGAKERIQDEIDSFARSRSSKQRVENSLVDQEKQGEVDYDREWRRFFKIGIEIAGEILEFVPGFSKELAQKIFKVGSSLFDKLYESAPQTITPLTQTNTPLNPYIIQCSTKAEAQRIKEAINEFCAPHIQNWWIDIQDRLIREGTNIRHKLVCVIQDDIQDISNELSNYLGDSLQIEININAIQFPSFEFKRTFEKSGWL